MCVLFVRLQTHMLSLGRLHVKSGVDSRYLDVMGPTFCQAIREGGKLESVRIPLGGIYLSFSEARKL